MMESMQSQAGEGKSPNHNEDEDFKFSTPVKDAAKKNDGVEAQEDFEEEVVVVKSTPGAISLSSDDEIDLGYIGMGMGMGSCKKLEPFTTPSFDCTACGREMLEAPRIYEHPVLLGVGICSTCYAILSTKRVVGDGWVEECTWCRRGEKIYNCEQCEKLFCEDCIVRNYSLTLMREDSKWRCFCCDPTLLSVHINELKEFQRLKANHSARKFRLDEKVTSVKDESPRRHPTIEEDESPRGDPTIEEMIRARFKEEEGKRHAGNGTKSCRQSSRVKSRVPISSKKRRRASTGEHARELKRQKGTPKQPIPHEPIPPPPRTYIRPHQMREKRRQAVAKRKAAIRANERLRGGEPSSSSEESPIKTNLHTKFTEISSDSEDL